MAVALTTLRGTIATALTNAGVWQVFAYPPPTPLPFSVIVSPGDPYLTPSNNSYNTIAPLATFRIVMTQPLLDNGGNLIGMEDMIIAVFNKLAASSLVFNVTGVSAPSVLTIGNSDLLTCDLSISILTSWS
tara:strand:+ start:747 stop:1139 length:393 start_codon:yes stop_codon:yes gene_type:complete